MKFIFRKMQVVGALLCLISTASHGQSAMNADVLEEVNFLRANPAEYASELDEFEQRFDGQLIMGEADEPDMITNEGVRAVVEAARAMRRVKPMGEIQYSAVLAQAAADHVRAQGRSGEVGHYSDGKGPGQRVKAHGGNIYVGEVIAYGVSGARDAVRQLIVDDGVPNRGHRTLLLNANYKYAGVACGPHRTWRNMCVIVLSESRDGSPIFSPRH